MFRFIRFIIEIAIVAGIVLWFLEYPGTVEIHWQGHIIKLTVAVAAFMLASLITAILLFHMLYRKIVNFPIRWRESRKVKQMTHALDLILDNFEAHAAKNVKKTLNTVSALEKLFPDHQLVQKIKAKSLLAEGHDRKALRIFDKLSHNPQTKFLGLKYLVEYHVANKNEEQVLLTLREIFETCPHQTEFHRLLLRYEVKGKSWDRALAVVVAMMKHREVLPAEYRRLKGTLLFFMGKELYEKANNLKSLAKVEEAYELRPGFTPIALFLAHSYADHQEINRAKKIIERSWRTCPHPALADFYKSLSPSEMTPTQWVSTLSNLHGLNPEDPMGHYLMAKACFEAELWGQVKIHLEKALKEAPHEAAIQLYNTFLERSAELAGSLTPIVQAIKHIPKAPLWQCHSCGALSAEWDFFCNSCHAMNHFLWGVPDEGAST